MSVILDDEPNNVLLDEGRRQASHQEVKSSIDEDVNSRIRQESARVEPEESAEMASVAKELKQKSIDEAMQTERETGRGRTAARISQVVDYFFYLIYGVIGLQFMLRLMGARSTNGFVQFISGLSWPLLAPFERIVPTPASGSQRVELSYLLALIVYILIHVAISGVFRLIAHRKVTI